VSYSKEWGPEGNRKLNEKQPSEILLYQGRGGRSLLTLQHCFNAQKLLKELMS